MSDVDLSILLNSILGVDGYEVGRFGSRYMIIQIKLNLQAVNGMPMMKSMLISSYFYSEMLSGCNNPPGFM
jgi:hypothetical protein